MLHRSRTPRRAARRRLAALACAALPCVAAAAPAVAQPAPDWSVQELVVTAAPAPVMWRLSRGESEVWVLGVLPLMPKDQAWNARPLERVIAGARVVLTPPVATAGLGSAFQILTQHGLPHGQTLDAQLTPELKARLDRGRAMAHVSPTAYAHDKPIWATLMLWTAYTRAARLSGAEPRATLERLARAHHVPVRPVASYKAGAMVTNFLHLTPQEGEACLGSILADIQAAEADARPAAQAWAKGDLKAVRAHYAEPSVRLCLEQATSYRALADRSVEDVEKALTAALATPGKSVAIFPLGELLRRGGALDRLRAEGVKVEAPEV